MLKSTLITVQIVLLIAYVSLLPKGVAASFTGDLRRPISKAALVKPTTLPPPSQPQQRMDMASLKAALEVAEKAKDYVGYSLLLANNFSMMVPVMVTPTASAVPHCQRMAATGMMCGVPVPDSALPSWHKVVAAAVENSMAGKVKVQLDADGLSLQPIIASNGQEDRLVAARASLSARFSRRKPKQDGVKKQAPPILSLIPRMHPSDWSTLTQ